MTPTPPIAALVLEDEPYAAAELLTLLAQVQPAIRVLAVLESVRAASDWLHEHAAPDLIFADLQLGDGLSFAALEQMRTPTPVVFVTAFDEYAVRAFQVNSIQYLLKPADLPALQGAVDKFMRQRAAAPAPDWGQLLSQLRPAPAYRTRFAVQQGDSVSYVPVEDIAYFEGDDRYVMLVTRAGKRYVIDYLLRDLETLLAPQRFFRINRSFIAQIDAIGNVTVLSKSRLAVQLRPATKRAVSVSAATATLFRRWLDEG